MWNRCRLKKNRQVINGGMTVENDKKNIGLYGSRAKSNYRDGSDIDLTLVGDALSHAQLNRIETQLDDLLLPYTIDLSLFGHIDNANLIDHIRRVGVVFYARDDV